MTTRRVTVVDYGVGNLHSVVKALRHEQGEVRVVTDPGELTGADRLVIPGVGAFPDGAAGLKRGGLHDALLQFAATGRPMLGICLGMQLLLGESEEYGTHRGLGIIPGRVVEIERRPNRKVPHIGWTAVAPPERGSWSDSLLDGVEPGTMFYFVHSFTAVPTEHADRLADADYAGARISAAIRRDNITGLQFHPEKSGPIGLRLIDRFLST